MGDLARLDGPALEKALDTTDRPLVVEFSAGWCPPCRMLAPVLHDLATKLPGKARFAMVDVDQSPELAERYEVMGLPTIGLFKGRQLVGRLVGYPGAEAVKDFLSRNL